MNRPPISDILRMWAAREVKAYSPIRSMAGDADTILCRMRLKVDDVVDTELLRWNVQMGLLEQWLGLPVGHVTGEEGEEWLAPP